MPSLKWIVPEGRPHVFPIFKKITSIGRGAGNDVAIETKTLREYHAQIVFDGTPEEVEACDDPRVAQFVRGEAGDRLKEMSGV